MRLVYNGIFHLVQNLSLGVCYTCNAVSSHWLFTYLLGKLLFLWKARIFFLQLNNFNQAVHCCGLLEMKRDKDKDIFIFLIFYRVYTAAMVDSRIKQSQLFRY